jgi:GDP-fucose transporter C1
LELIQVWKQIIPLSAARVIGILAKTYCLASVDASFYQIARGLLLPFTLILSYTFLPKQTRLGAKPMIGCMTVVVGFIFAFFTEHVKTTTSSLGLLLGVGSSFTTAAESIVVKHFLSKTDIPMLSLVTISTMYQLFVLIPLCMVRGEASTLFASVREQGLAQQLILVTAATGAANFLLVIATFLQISITSPITHTIVTAGRGVVQSVLASLTLSEPLSTGRIGSMSLLAFGTILYGVGKEETRRLEVLGTLPSHAQQLEVEKKHLLQQEGEG